MKILVFSGGLGNQIFGCAFYKFLQKQFPNESIYGIYNSLWLREHNGLEVDKYFDVELPKSGLIARLSVVVLFFVKKLHLFRYLITMDTRTYSPDAIVYSASKTHLKFIPKDTNWIQFKRINLMGKNVDAFELIKDSQSVFIHVRRGDYYLPKYIKRLGGTCPVEYYEQAIRYMQNKVDNLKFFVFSDDMEWVKNNIDIPNPFYIDWNKGSSSYIDMYLMSECKYAIIANSTFSYWGAMLGAKKLITIYPSKWVNPPFDAPKIFPKNWIKI